MEEGEQSESLRSESPSHQGTQCEPAQHGERIRDSPTARAGSRSPQTANCASADGQSAGQYPRSQLERERDSGCDDGRIERKWCSRPNADGSSDGDGCSLISHAG